MGGGGFSIPRYLRATRPGTHSTVLEIDGDLVPFVEEELGLVLGPDLEVEIGDARLHLRAHAGDEVDLIVGDAFGSRSVPWHLATRSSSRRSTRAAADDGVYAPT